MSTLLERITLDAEICHGKPCVRGMRWPVEVILDMLSGGMSFDEILADHPELTREDLLSCIAYASAAIGNSRLLPVA